MTPTAATAGTLPRPAATVDRLAELVAHLTDCPADLAVAAVARALPRRPAALSLDDRLRVVATALLDLRGDPRCGDGPAPAGN